MKTCSWNEGLECTMAPAHEARVTELLAEVERLRAERKNCPPVSESEYVSRLEDEVERLCIERDDWRRCAETSDVKEQELRAEVERLRTALKVIADYPDDGFGYGGNAVEVARAALEEGK